jgi:hypothetical protein
LAGKLEAAAGAVRATCATWRAAGDALEHAVREAVADDLEVDVAQVEVMTLCAHRSGEVTLAWYVTSVDGLSIPAAGEYFTGPGGGWYVQGLGKVDSPRAP